MNKYILFKIIAVNEIGKLSGIHNKKLSQNPITNFFCLVVIDFRN